jgi:hypothetical protein
MIMSHDRSQFDSLSYTERGVVNLMWLTLVRPYVVRAYEENVSSLYIIYAYEENVLSLLKILRVFFTYITFISIDILFDYTITYLLKFHVLLCLLCCISV